MGKLLPLPRNRPTDGCGHGISRSCSWLRILGSFAVVSLNIVPTPAKAMTRLVTTCYRRLQARPHPFGAADFSGCGATKESLVVAASVRVPVSTPDPAGRSGALPDFLLTQRWRKPSRMGDQLSILRLIVEAASPRGRCHRDPAAGLLWPGHHLPKRLIIGRARRGADQFENSFWSAGTRPL